MATRKAELIEPGDVIKTRKGDLKVSSFIQMDGLVTISGYLIRSGSRVSVDYYEDRRVTLVKSRVNSSGNPQNVGE